MEQTALRMNGATSGQIIVPLIICQELTVIELFFLLIRHDPFLPHPLAQTYTMAISYIDESKPGASTALTDTPLSCSPTHHTFHIDQSGWIEHVLITNPNTHKRTQR